MFRRMFIRFNGWDNNDSLKAGISSLCVLSVSSWRDSQELEGRERGREVGVRRLIHGHTQTTTVKRV
jgi:hypothetical protein